MVYQESNISKSCLVNWPNYDDVTDQENAVQDDMIPEDWTRKPIRCQRFVTHCADPNLVVWERLYVSDHATESFYKTPTHETKVLGPLTPSRTRTHAEILARL